MKAIEHLNELNIQVDGYFENKVLCGYELNTYTDGGVNMIIFLDFRDSELDPKNEEHFIQAFNDRIKDIDIDEEIELHRQDKRYCNNFSIKESLEDFTDWKNGLENIFSEERGFTPKNKKQAVQRQFEQTVDKFRSVISELEDILELMPIKGIVSEDCQRTFIQSKINSLDSAVNGVKLEDFVSNEYSSNFKLSYS